MITILQARRFMNYCMQIKKINKSAFAFSITLWIIASILLATVVILRFAKDEVKLSQGLKDKLQTQMMALSVLESVKFYVPTANYGFTSLSNTLLDDIAYPLPSEIIVDGREYNLSKNITLSLKDTSAMQHVMYGSSKLISQSLTTKSTDDLASILENSLADWRDDDDLVRSNGAEQNVYDSSNEKRLVRNNRAIQDIHELKLLKGFDKINFNTIKSNLYYGRRGSMNLMLINNQRYLATLLGVDENFMANLLELRASEPSLFIKGIGRVEGFNDDYMGFALSKQFIIKIVVQRGKARSILEALLSFKVLNERPYIIVSFRLN